MRSRPSRSFPLRRLFPLLLVAAAGCRGISVQATHDPSADFASYRYYDWLSVPPQAQTKVSDASLVDLIGAELAARGVQHSRQAPDLLVAVHRSIEGNLNTKGWGYQAGGDQFDRYTYQEGTLVVDLVDAKTKRTVWRGAASGVFKFETDPAARRAMITDLLRDMFADYPPRK